MSRLLPRTGADEAVREEFASCYASNFTGLATQLYVYTGDLDVAQELVQEAFCRALARWPKLVAYEDPAAWVRRVAFNLANSRWQRARVALRYLRRQRIEHTPGPSPDRVAVNAALARLPMRYRRVLVLHYVAGLSVAEIAGEEGVAVGTVKAWLHRARHALAQLIGEGDNHG
jgi:RNA polymerase sigma-70 factor, ECF subfamily